ncbi:GIY-YIG nuclease family protein [Methylocaldum szegediense]|nr:GIY-YIG nuclease family protein [Methylocaldum szegediense]
MPESSVQDGRPDTASTSNTRFLGTNGLDMDKQPCVYMLASRRNGTLYVGVTSNLVGRVFQHRNGLVEGFTKKYGVHMLVWFELHERMESAILREKRIKKWPRAAKIGLIEASNPEWRDLWTDLTGGS